MKETIEQQALRMAKGNMGAIRIIAELASDGIIGLSIIHWLDQIKLEGSQLYMLFNDCCGMDINKVKAVKIAHEEGRLTSEEIIQNVSQTYGKPFNV
jgi:hypothetical protein